MGSPAAAELVWVRFGSCRVVSGNPLCPRAGSFALEGSLLLFRGSQSPVSLGAPGCNPAGLPLAFHYAPALGGESSGAVWEPFANAEEGNIWAFQEFPFSLGCRREASSGCNEVVPPWWRGGGNKSGSVFVSRF